jgi:hypothetical protein
MTADKDWPEGRTLFYEGNHPEKFVEEIKRKFGFDPSARRGQYPSAIRDGAVVFGPLPKWGEVVGTGDDASACYAFHCPPEHLEGLYATDYPLGT